MVPEGLAAKLLGTFAGTALSLLFIIPRTRTEAFRRFFVSVIAGYVGGAPLADYMGLPHIADNDIFTHAIAAAAGWWIVGLAYAVLRRYQKENS